MRIVLLGAGNRVEMVSHLLDSVRLLEPGIEIVAVESSLRVPVAHVVKVREFTGPFSSDEFLELLATFGRDSKTLIVPFMESAAQAISSAGSLENIVSPIGPWVADLASKQRQKELASSAGIAVPSTASNGWAHVKPIAGNGSKGTQVVWLDPDLPKDPHMLYEEVVEGLEVSLDVYVDQQGQAIVSARDRLRVTGGEVQHTIVREPTRPERLNVLLLVEKFQLRGPCNIQFKGSPATFLEINPRFGGGSTSSLEAGWKAWDWLIREYLFGEKLDESMHLEPLEMKRAWKDYYWR